MERFKAFKMEIFKVDKTWYVGRYIYLNSTPQFHHTLDVGKRSWDVGKQNVEIWEHIHIFITPFHFTTLSMWETKCGIWEVDVKNRGFDKLNYML